MVERIAGVIIAAIFVVLFVMGNMLLAMPQFSYNGNGVG